MGSEVDVLIRKNITNFCKILVPHVETWRSTLQESAPIVRGVANRAEQFRYVHEANIKYIEDFAESKKTLEYNIMTGIEEDLVLLNKCVTKLSRANQELRNKLLLLESSTLDLDWDGPSQLLRGSGSVPSLTRLLQAALRFWTFFQNAHRNIGDGLKNMNWLDDKRMADLEKAFDIDLGDARVNYLIAITQYVDNENNII